jgi:hypothetical protein
MYNIHHLSCSYHAKSVSQFIFDTTWQIIFFCFGNYKYLLNMKSTILRDEIPCNPLEARCPFRGTNPFHLRKLFAVTAVAALTFTSHITFTLSAVGFQSAITLPVTGPLLSHLPRYFEQNSVWLTSASFPDLHVLLHSIRHTPFAVLPHTGDRGYATLPRYLSLVSYSYSTLAVTGTKPE